MKNTLRLITLGSLLALATACGGQSGEARTGESSADLSSEEGGDQAPANEQGSAGSEPGGGSDGNVGGPVSSPPTGHTVDPDTSVSDEPGSTAPGHPGGDVDPVAPSCVPEFDPSTSAGESPCNFVAGGKCFVDGADACACAGCAEDQCLILESYPAQARCP